MGRKYKMPIGFSTWDQIHEKCHLFNAPPCELRMGGKLALAAYASWYFAQRPLYCISQEMIEQFKENDISKIVLDGIDKLSLNFSLAIPKGSLFDPDGGDEIDSIVITDSLREYNNHHLFDYVVATITEHGCYTNWGTLLDIGASTPGRSDTHRILDSIAIQSAFAIAYAPDLISESTGKEFASGTGFAKSKNADEERFSRPRWIGKNYTRAKSLPRGGSHASPIDHWRRGHWRNQACGVGRIDRKLVYVRPAFIGKC